MFKRFLTLILIIAASSYATFSAGRNYSDEKIQSLEKKIADLTDQINAVKGANEDTSAALRSEIERAELDRRQVVRAASQDELLTQAVARISPAVVSIVISKDVPQLEVVYENPFGNDPFFKDFGFRIPVYRQKGTVRQKVGGGTGFIIRKDGYIITNRHVVSDNSASYTALLSDGSQKTAKVVYKDDAHDLAILKIEGASYSTVELGNSASLKLGQTVIAIGNALAEYSNSVSVGIISGLNRTIEAGNNQGQSETLSGVIQTDAAINPGNSGGPLIDLSGKVMGINVATVVGSSNISFSIPINDAKNIINSVVK